jgi:hypothetical protein
MFDTAIVTQNCKIPLTIVTSGGNFAKYWGGGASAEGTRFLKFDSDIRKIFKIWIPEMAFTAF